MKYSITTRLAAVMTAPALLIALNFAVAAPPDASYSVVLSRVSVFATGLNNPRWLKFGPDGELYVAEGGIAGQISTISLCPQVPAVDPYTGSPTGARISRINRHGYRETGRQHPF